MPEIRELRYFIALAEELHFGRAADRLHLSQSALSHAIRKLEDKLGFSLFHRGGGSVSITSEGRQILGDAQRVVNGATRLERRAASLLEGDRCRLTVAYVPSVQQAAAASIRRFTASTGVGVDHQRSPQERVMTFIEAGLVDVAIAHAATVRGPLRNEYFASGPLLVAVGDRHPLAGRRTIALADLEGFRIPYVHEAGRQLWQMLFANHGLAVDVIRIEDPVVGAPTELLRRDPTIAWLQTDEYGPTGDLHRIEFEPPVEFAFQAIYREDSPNPAVAGFVDFLQGAHRRCATSIRACKVGLAAGRADA